MNDDFVKIDLHIHTPASKCYNGKKDDSEFLDILRKAKKEKLKIIAITDHNSIQGYKRINEIKTALINEKEALSSIYPSKQSGARLKQLEIDLQLFKDILVLPGVEFEVRTGIHLLAIFSNDTSIEIIEKFLRDGGYGPQHFGEEKLSTLANWDIFDFFEESKKLNCLIVDAHTDRPKGIWYTTQPGTVRAACFRSPQLNAVCYKNEGQIERLKQILQLSREYSRQVPLSFVKFSDAHSVSEIGSAFTWVRIDSIDLESLRTAFANPSELVSIEMPVLKKILDELLSKANSFGIPDLSDASKEDFKRYICSLHNSIGGNILFGADEKKKVIGIPGEANHIAREIIECFKDIEGRFRYKITGYPLQNRRAVFSISVPQDDNLINIQNDGRLYSIKDRSIKVLSAAEVQALVEDRLIDDLGSRIGKRISAVEKDCQLVKNLFSSMPIIRAFETSSVRGRFDLEVSESIELSFADIEKLKNISENGNGTSRGNIYFIMEELQPPRLQHAYLRYSLPLFMLRNMKQRALAKETIYIAPGGGVYFDKKDYPIFSHVGYQVLKLHKTSRNARYGMKFTTCFLKSSFLLWYCRNRFDNIDLQDPEIFTNLRLPTLKIDDPFVKDQLTEIECHCDKIIRLEKNFLIVAKRVKEAEMKEHQAILIDKHNAEVGKIAYEIDRSIYKLLKLNENEISVIEDNLRLNEMYLPKSV